MRGLLSSSMQWLSCHGNYPRWCGVCRKSLFRNHTAPAYPRLTGFRPFFVIEIIYPVDGVLGRDFSGSGSPFVYDSVDVFLDPVSGVLVAFQDLQDLGLSIPLFSSLGAGVPQLHVLCLEG